MKLLHLCLTFSQPTCGIGAYTRNLADAIKEVFPDTQQSILEGGFLTAIETLYQLRPQACHVQLEYGFCSAERLQLIGEVCGEIGCRFVITYHTLAAQPHNQVQAIRLAHTPLAANYGSFQIIPSGIPRVDIPFGLEEELRRKVPMGPIMANQPYLFFGQAHPHKQLLEILQLVKTAGVSLVCIVSKPVQGDTAYYDHCRVEALRNPSVIWLDVFLNDGEALMVARYCRAALFPYTEYGSVGVSAAVKLLLNCPELPIYTTYASHFSDLPDEGVLNKYHYVEDMLAIDLTHSVAVRQQWVEDNSFQNVARKHLELYGNG